MVLGMNTVSQNSIFHNLAFILYFGKNKIKKAFFPFTLFLTQPRSLIVIITHICIAFYPLQGTFHTLIPIWNLPAFKSNQTRPLQPWSSFLIGIPAALDSEAPDLFFSLPVNSVFYLALCVQVDGELFWEQVAFSSSYRFGSSLCSSGWALWPTHSGWLIGPISCSEKPVLEPFEETWDWGHCCCAGISGI